MGHSFSFVILGAGLPHRGDLPAALGELYSGSSILNWMVDSAGCPLSKITFVSGYQSELVRARFPDLTVVENKSWETTGSGESLCQAFSEQFESTLVCYSDILFRKAVVEKVSEVSADVVLAVDSYWRSRFSGRSIEDLVNSEKVIVNDGKLERIGKDIPPDWATGEFIGLAMFSAPALEKNSQTTRKRP